MPGKVSGSTPRASRRTAAPKSTASRSSAQSINIPDEGINTSLRRAICSVYADAQKSNAAHRKACISLRKVQEACVFESDTTTNPQPNEDFDEHDFNREFIRCLLRALPVKRSEPVGDRIVRFAVAFLCTACQKDNEVAPQDDRPTFRLVSLVYNTLIPMLPAKDKNVRYRTTQILSCLINEMDKYDDRGMLDRLRIALMKRTHDKEASVRLQSVYGLIPLAGEGENSEDEDESDLEDVASSSVVRKLHEMLANDPSGDVRRRLLLSFAVTPENADYMLNRGRDVDSKTRQAVFTQVLPRLGDFRKLTLFNRERMLRYGLMDREEGVRKAAVKLFREYWIENCVSLPDGKIAKMHQAQEEGEQDQPAVANQTLAAAPSIDALGELLQRIDIMKSGLEDGIAGLAMREFWDGRPDYLEYVSFPADFWDKIGPELAFLVRSFNDYCRSGKGNDSMSAQELEDFAEAKLPEVTRFSQLLQHELSRMTDSMHVYAADDSDGNRDEYEQREFVVIQMLHMATTFDYSDEEGRRHMRQLMRAALARTDLPHAVTRLVVNILRLLCNNSFEGEQEFRGYVMDAIYDIQDQIETDDGDQDNSSVVDESFHSATSQPDDDSEIQVALERTQAVQSKADPEEEEQKEEQRLANTIKCLKVAAFMLQNIQCESQGDKQLDELVQTLILPAARPRHLELRANGFQCLALACILDKVIANNNTKLFAYSYSKSHDFWPELAVICLQSISDILVVHPSLFAPSQNGPDTSDVQPNEHLELFNAILKKSLKSQDETVQATGAIAISKAMLSGSITDPTVLKSLVTSYFEPDNVNKPRFQQALSYFFPVYCHSRAENALRMVHITCELIAKLVTRREHFFDGAEVDTEIPGEGLVKLNTISQMLVDWTDPRKIVGFAEATNSSDIAVGASATHFALAQNILERLMNTQVARDERKDEKKTLLSMLGKLHLPAGGCTTDMLQDILELLVQAIDARIASDETSKKSLTKLHSTLVEFMHDAMTEERGGGGAEETVLESTEVDDETLRPAAEEATEFTEAEDNEEDDYGDDDDDDDDDDAESQLQREMREMTDATSTAGFGFTTGLPDAEGTRIQDFVDEGTTVEDTEMMDVDG